MSLDTDTEVTEMQRVRDGSGNDVPPAGRDQQERQTNAAENAEGGFSDSMQPATAGEYAPAYTPAEGTETLFLADPANSGPIYVGFDGAATLPVTAGNGVTFALSDTSTVYVRADTAGDVLHVIGEGGA